MNEVWITGAGVISALGSGLDTHTTALLDSKCGLTKQSFFNGESPDPVICGMIPADTLPMTIEESAAERATMLLSLSTEQALQNAGLSHAENSDIIAGTTLGNMHGGTSYYQKLRKNKPADISLLKQFLPCAPVAAIAKKFGIGGKRLTVASACGSASSAIGQAFHLVHSGLSQEVIAGGFEALSPFVIAGFNSLQLVSKRESRPFDRNRKGLNPGEGSAMFIIEPKETACKRNAQPLARITGFGDGLDAYHHTRAHPEGQGLIIAINKSLKTAGLSKKEIDIIHLHGTGTTVNDSSEFTSLSACFGSRLKDIPVCSTKPMTGHTFGASGALNIIFSLLSIRENVIPATLFHENCDPEFVGMYFSRKPQKADSIQNILSISLGFGGEAFALIISGMNK